MEKKREPAGFGQSTPAGNEPGGKDWCVYTQYTTICPCIQPVRDLPQLVRLARWRAIRAADQGQYIKAAQHLDLYYGLQRQWGPRMKRRWPTM